MSILGRPIKNSNKPHPLIEISGAIDCGKKVVAQLVCKKIGAQLLSFPVLSPYSATGRALLQLLSTKPEELEQNPHWWAHIYAANLYEHRSDIRKLLAKGPVLLTNYVQGFRLWSGALDIDMSNYYRGFTIDLPEPDLKFILLGGEWNSPGNLRVKLSRGLVMNVQRSVNSCQQTKIHMDFDQEKHRATVVNKTAELIAQRVATKYPDIKVHSKQQYDVNYFMPKKDEL